MGVDDAVWASVRRLHETTREPAAHLCRRLGVSLSTYYKRRKREKWGARPTPSRQRKAAAATRGHAGGVDRTLADRQVASTPKHSDAAEPATHRRLIDRLYAAIDKELQQLETGAPSVAELERRTRTLTNMIRGFEKVLELDADKQKIKDGKRKPRAGQRGRDAGKDDVGDEADHMRQQIAERLERLNAQRSNHGQPQGSERSRD